MQKWKKELKDDWFKCILHLLDCMPDNGNLDIKDHLGE